MSGLRDGDTDQQGTGQALRLVPFNQALAQASSNECPHAVQSHSGQFLLDIAEVRW